MKNKAVKGYLTLVFLFSNLMLFADPGDESDTGDLESGEPMPINSKLVVLAIAGIMFACYFFYKNRKRQIV
ncbi:hypothetical protein [Flavobacterium restrictum]|uniref:LPXTG cell wall anchor domain-containing protein n=1 Tax=Flavobacterium restrictum TaxID=2594428 RepID=A0A553E294_9FLAO|nr:hypothetical protein [Flavobacterium restrictum]TRX39164.1 hypothetical protein FNW21_09515 [Flavobacterium restrictum]